jgi:2-oxoglutarate dehydrogenase E1 component
MGAWSYVSPHLASLVDSAIEVEVISRPERSSPATGLSDLYQAEQEQIIAEALLSPVGHKPTSARLKN